MFIVLVLSVVLNFWLFEDRVLHQRSQSHDLQESYRYRGSVNELFYMLRFP